MDPLDDAGGSRVKPGIVLGFDVSKRRVGAATVDYTTSSILDASLHHITDTPSDITNRHTAFQAIAKAANKRGVVLAVFIEDGFLMRHTGMLASLYAIGHIEAWAHQTWPGILVDRIKPATWRSTLGLAARGKDDPLFFAREHFHTDTDTHLATHLGTKSTQAKSSGEQDAADAICIALAGRALLWRGGTR